MERESATLPPLRLLNGLGQAALYGLAGPNGVATSGFGPGSAPYFWASEFPAAALGGLAAALKPPVLCVAGSGDNAIELLRLGLAPLLAVDVSRPACYVNELKAAALASGIGLKEYSTLFPAPPRPLPRRLSSWLSPEAEAFWLGVADAGDLECASLLDREPEPGLLAYLSTEASFAQTSSAVGRWPLLNLSLECFLELTPDLFGLIYVSNVCEYIARGLLLADRGDEIRARLSDFYRLAASRLAAGGAVLAYVFEPAGRVFSTGPEVAAMAAAGLDVRPIPVEFTRRGGSFRHCLLVGQASRGKCLDND
ncbi:MAG: hypothetical protein V2A77_02635 [Pseudomonadota bacterium]